MPKQTFFNLPDAKKDHIIRAAVEEFSKALYQEISINHLIKCMEIPTGSFYQYFDDKRDLYFYILSHYLDQMLDESVHDGKHLDILHPNSKSTNTSIFAHTRKSTPYYQEIFVDNFNKAPRDLKREWTFDKLIGSKYMALYNYDLFDSSDIDPYIKENKYLMMGLAMSVSSTLQCFCSRKEDEEKYKELYKLCINVIKTGIINYSPEQLSGH